MRHGTLNFRAIIYSTVLHVSVLGVVAWTLSWPREPLVLPQKEPVIATLWSAPLPAHKIKPAVVSTPDLPPEKITEQELPETAPEPAAAEPTPEVKPQSLPVEPVQPTKMAWGETSPLTPLPGEQIPTGSVPQSADDVTPKESQVDFDEVMRLAAENVAATGAAPLKSTDLDGIEMAQAETQKIEPLTAAAEQQTIPEEKQLDSAPVDEELLHSSFDPLTLYQQKVASMIQKSLRLTSDPSGTKCMMGIQLMNNGLIVESYRLSGDEKLCEDAIKATARIGALPPPPKELGDARFHNLRVTILF